jgi:hypothetical protein
MNMVGSLKKEEQVKRQGIHRAPVRRETVIHSPAVSCSPDRLFKEDSCHSAAT